MITIKVPTKPYPDSAVIDQTIRDAAVLIIYAKQWTPSKGMAARLNNALLNLQDALKVR